MMNFFFKFQSLKKKRTENFFQKYSKLIDYKRKNLNPI